MITIVGLGNPGSEYAQTKHNVGFVVVDRLAEQLGLSWESKSKFQVEVAKNNQVTLIKPMSFMNKSGQSVRAVLDFFQKNQAEDKAYDQLYVVHDDLDLELGTYKFHLGRGPHGHNGLLSLYQHLGSKQFWHVRVGVDARAGLRIIPPDVYVLSPFEAGETRLAEAVVEQVGKELLNRVHASL
jgi:peptidyl-tRNA hydrolase, PTH1 family